MISALTILTALTVCFQDRPPERQALERYEFSQKQMGVPFGITLYAPSEAVANAASDAAYARVKQLNGILSDYEPESELMRLGRTSGRSQVVPVSDELWHVLTRSQALAEETNGAFDVTVGPIVKLWRLARRKKELPDPEKLEVALSACGYRSVKLFPSTHSVELLAPGMQLDVGGIAKGYAADEALAVLKKHGLTRALVAASGDIAVGDPPPGQTAWRIGIAPLLAPDAPPSRFVLLSNAAVSTSGDAWQYVEIDGKRYSHIVDPHTGMGLTNRSSVTVIAPRGITADGLDTACSVLGPEKGLPLIEKTEGAAALTMELRGTEIETRISKRMEAYLAPDREGKPEGKKGPAPAVKK